MFALLASFSLLAAALPAPYSELETVLPFNPQGWYSNRKQIEALFKDHKIKTVVEVGSWLGQSTRHIATLLPKNGKIYAVDHWLGSVEHTGNEFVPTLYEQFLSNVIHAGLTDKIIPVRMDSLMAAHYLFGTPVDLVYIDGAHDFASVMKDLEAWYPYVKGRGILCGDDWTWPGVKQAVKTFADRHRLEITHKKAFWRLIEK